MFLTPRFLELALISFALLTGASALAGRPGGVDAAAVWGVSLASGTFSALHELVGPAIGSTRALQVDPGSLRAACVRLTAPLVAALLWERVLTAARREHEARSLVQVRRDHRLISVAQAALRSANCPRTALLAADPPLVCAMPAADSSVRTPPPYG